MQIHSSEYRNPSSLPHGDVLVVGAAASGTQIAEELAASRTVYLSVGTRPRSIPRSIFGRDCFWWYDKFGHRHTIETRIGRWLSRQPDPLIGPRLRELRKHHGIRPLPRAIAAVDGGVRFSDGRVMRPSSVVWCTGFRHDFSWIRVPVCDARSMPDHRRGVTRAPGLYFLGLSWQWTRGSALIGWVGDDARYIASRIAGG